MKASILFAIASVLAAAPLVANSAPQGSYIKSCTDIRVEGSTLSAVCQTRDGSWKSSALIKAASCKGDIPNWNGNLSCQQPGGSWAASCTNLHVDDNSGEISADCRRRDQTINKARHSPAGFLTNCNGNLTIAKNC